MFFLLQKIKVELGKHAAEGLPSDCWGILLAFADSEVPVVYAYATTMRRAQGSTLELVGLYFDRRRADRGYGYVGASRARLLRDVYLLGRVRRSDWRPVGGDPRGGEQDRPGPMSESDSEEDSSSESDHDSDDRGSEFSGGEPDHLDFCGWNRMRLPDWAPSGAEIDASEWGMAFESGGIPGDLAEVVDDAAGLFV